MCSASTYCWPGREGGASGSDAGHVAHGHLDVVAVRLLAHPVNHVLRQLDAVHAHARFQERQGDTTGTHGELQRVSPTGELGEERDGLLLVASSVDTLQPGYHRNLLDSARIAA
jgi:hypothetical protein